MKKLSQLGMPVILVLFLVVGFLLINISARTYEKLIKRSQTSFESRTPLYYIANKIRQKDEFGAVSIKEKEGQQVLILEERIEGEIYETWVYAYNHKLCEAYVARENDVSLESGFELLDIEDLHFEKQASGLLLIQLHTVSGELYELFIQPRSKGI